MKVSWQDVRQRWRRASASAAAKKITEMAEYFPELSVLFGSYSLCERYYYYNQIVVKKSFIKRVTETNDNLFRFRRKRLRLSSDNDLLAFEKTFSYFGVQVSLHTEFL